MIAVDTNLLIYAHRRDSEWYERASTLLKTLAEGPASWAVPWSCVHEFVAITTHPRIFLPPSTLDQAIDQVDAWMEAPTLVLLTETPTHWSTLRSQLVAGRVTGPKVHDARIAAICLAHGVSELWSADRDFSRFPELTLRNPLLG